MGPKKTCKHTRLRASCASCRALKKRWYAKLAADGFVDIEYGLDRPRYLAHVPDPATPGAQQAQNYYESVWQVFHAWCDSGRPLRDCRIAELFAMQRGDTGTVRGISRVLEAERLPPFSLSRVHRTLEEIDAAARAVTKNTSDIAPTYMDPRNKAA